MSRESCWLCGERLAPVEWPGDGPLERCGGCGVLLRSRAKARGELAILPEVVEARRGLHRGLLKLVSFYVRRGRLLDVGCGSGEFLELARKAGWKVKGVEPHPEGARQARTKDLNVADVTLPAAAFPDAAFDVVTLWDVLDYAPDPLALLREAFRVLRGGGWLWVRTRNGPFNLAAWTWGRRLGLGSVQNLAVLHRNGFTGPALERALAVSGFMGSRRLSSPLADPAAYARGPAGPLARAAGLAARAGLPGPSLLACARKPWDYPRVLHLITRLDVGGSSTNVLRCAEWLEDKRDVLVASGPGEQGSRRGAALVGHLQREINPWNDLLAFFEILLLIWKWDPDALRTHTSKAGFLGRWAAFLVNRLRRKGYPLWVVHTPHGHVFYGYFGALKSRLYLWLERLTAPITYRLVAISEGEKRESLAFGVGRPDQWVIIPSGVELERPTVDVEQAKARLKRAHGVPEDSLVIGTVARLEPVKGVIHLVDAAGLAVRLGAGGARWLVVGDGSERSRLERRTRELGLEERFILAGQQKDVLPWIRAMDIYVQPSVNEGMCKTLLYAQFLGVPVVASRVCGIPDVVEEGRSGLLVPPGNPAALARAIVSLIEDDGLRRRLGRGGPASAGRLDPETKLPYFSSENMYAQLVKLYASMRTP